MKILFSDYDGTLRINGKVSSKNVEAIKKFQVAGNTFAIATGRGFNSIKAECNKYGISPTYFVCNNGGAVFDANGNIIDLKTVSVELTKIITDKLLKFGCVGYSYNDGIKRSEKIVSEEAAKKIMTCKDSEMSCEEMLEKGKIGQIVGFIKGIDYCRECSEKIAAEFSEEIDAYSNLECVDIVPKGNSKANGIKKVIDKENILIDEIYTVGDALNDVSMVKEFHGAALDHAVEDVKEVSERTVESVAAYIEELL